jgi:hypothetical protein
MRSGCATIRGLTPDTLEVRGEVQLPSDPLISNPIARLCVTSQSRAFFIQRVLRRAVPRAVRGRSSLAAGPTIDMVGGALPAEQHGRFSHFNFDDVAPVLATVLRSETMKSHEPREMRSIFLVMTGAQSSAARHENGPRCKRRCSDGETCGRSMRRCAPSHRGASRRFDDDLCASGHSP